MFSKSALKIAALSMALFGLTACETFATKADKAPNTEQSTATASTQQATAVPVLVKRQGENALEIYVGSADAKKTDKEQRLKAGDVHYYTNGIILKREDIQNAFVAKTMNDQPALALRLKPDSVSKLSKARKGYSHILASINGNVVSTVEGHHGELMDGVLLMPMPTLVSARDAADLIR